MAETAARRIESASQRAAYLAFDAFLPEGFKRALIVIESVVRLPAVLQDVMRDVEGLKDIVADLRKRDD